MRTVLCSDTVMARPPFSAGPTLRTTIKPSKSSATIISPVRYRLESKRVIAAPIRIAPGPLQQASLNCWAIW